MDWFKKHADSIGVIVVILGGCWWVNFGVQSFRADIDPKMASFDSRLNSIEKDLAVIKAVLVMKEILPRELAVNADSP